jgi:hypothetical protein
MKVEELHSHIHNSRKSTGYRHRTVFGGKYITNQSENIWTALSCFRKSSQR